MQIGNSPDLRAGEKIQDQDRVGQRCPVLPSTGTAAGGNSCLACPLVQSAEALSTATRTNAELLALSGKRSPYAGKLGVLEQGALADLLLVEGNPLENIKLIADPAKNFKVIMKGGRIYKDCAVTTATSPCWHKCEVPKCPLLCRYWGDSGRDADIV